MAQTFRGLTVEAIIDLNRQMIESSGDDVFIEPDNVRVEGMIHQITQEVEETYFDQELFPTASEKAAVLCWRIIAGHLFHNGNNRTGVMVLYQTLEHNGYTLMVTDDEMWERAKGISKGRDNPGYMAQDGFVEWVQKHVLRRQNKRRNRRR